MSALILVDVQYDFLPGGALAVSQGNDVIPVIQDLLKKYDWDAIVASKDWHPAGHISFASSHPGEKPFTGKRIDSNGHQQTLWPDHCLQDTKGSQIPPELQSLLDSPSYAPRVHTVLKGDDLETDAYSAFHCSTPPKPLSNPPALPASSTSSLLSQHLHARGIKQVVVTGLATDYCVKATAMGALLDGFDTVVVEEACKAVEGTNEPTWQQLRKKGAKVVSVQELGTVLL